MKYIDKLEQIILGWVSKLPHLPVSAKRWLSANIWWIVLVLAIIQSINTVYVLFSLMPMLLSLNHPQGLYLVSLVGGFWSVIVSTFNLIFSVISLVLLYTAITPLKNMLKKGWVLLFAAWIVSAVHLVAGTSLTLNPLFLVVAVLYGAVSLAVSGYLLFEIHGHFAHVKTTKTNTKQ